MTDLVIAGYLSAPRPSRAGWSSDRQPAQFISMSECLTGVVHGPEFWAWHTDPDAAARFDGSLLSTGLARADAAALAEEVRSAFGEAAEHADAEGLALLVKPEPMPEAAQPRGFEVVGVEAGLMSVHSWLCHGYEMDLPPALGVLPNQWGLIDTYAQTCPPTRRRSRPAGRWWRSPRSITPAADAPRPAHPRQRRGRPPTR